MINNMHFAIKNDQTIFIIISAKEPVSRSRNWYIIIYYNDDDTFNETPFINILYSV